MVTLVLTLLAAEPVPAELKIAAPGLTVTGIDAALSAPLTDQLARPLAPIRVITPRDIAALLGLERQKELLGCAGAGSCMAELGNALGVQGVLLGDIVELGKAIQVNTRVIDPVAGRQLAAASRRVGSEGELFDALTQMGLELRQQFYASQGLVAPPPLIELEPPAPKSRGTRRFFPIPLVVGGAGVITGAVFLGLAESSYQQLVSGMPNTQTLQSAEIVASNGKMFQTVGAVVLGIGLAALVAGVALLIFGSAPE